MATGDRRQASIDSSAWDKAREVLRSDPRPDLELHMLARELRFPRWTHRSGKTKLKTLLAMSWVKVNDLWYYWYPRTPEDVAQLLFVAAGMECLPTPVCEQRLDPIDVDDALNRLGIPRTTSVELLHVSARARRFLKEEGLTQLGPLLDFLADGDVDDILSHSQIGRRTVRQFLDIVRAIHEGVPDHVRMYLPLSLSGYGISFSASAAMLLNAASPEDREALYRHLYCRMSLRHAGIPSGRTRARIGQVITQFLQAIDRNLKHFPDEKRRLQAEWDAGRPLEAALGEELDLEGKCTVRAALVLVFDIYEHNRAFVAGRLSAFRERDGT